jgi:hypothetical protein
MDALKHDAHSEERLSKLINNQPLRRELYLQILDYCSFQRLLGSIEQAIQGYPQYSDDICPFFLIEDLYLHGGLAKVELDSLYVPLTAERTAGLTPDEVDDIISDYVGV